MATAEAIERVEPTEFQARAGAGPDRFDLFLGGGRGGGKTRGLLFIVLRHCEQHGRHARVLIVRRHFPDMRDLEAEARYLFGAAYGKRLGYNAQTHRFTFPNGAIVQLDQIEGPADFTKFQGQSNSLVVVDEAGQFPDPQPLDLLRSTLRTQASICPRMILAANPGGAGHGWLHQRHVAGVEPWKPYTETKTGSTFVTAPSTLADNPHLSGDYADQIAAATTTDPELQKAWLHGDWAIARGAFFGPVIEESRNAVDPWPVAEYPNRIADLRRRGWRFYLAHDYGAAAPSVTYICAESPGDEGPDGRFYPRGSIVLIDELATNEPGSLDRGMNYTVPRLAEEIREMCEARGVRPDGVADDACFSAHGHEAGSIADEFRKNGVHFTKAHKGDRIGGWQKVRTLLANAGKPDVPGLYVTRDAEYWWSTVPFLGRDPRRAEDVDTRSADHAADATRYGVLHEHRKMQRVPLIGL